MIQQIEGAVIHPLSPACVNGTREIVLKRVVAMEKNVLVGVIGAGRIGISSGWSGNGNGAVNYIVLLNNTGSTRRRDKGR